MQKQSGWEQAVPSDVRHATQVVEALQKDDKDAFLALVDEKKTTTKLCFGRFPVLSVAYLFGAKNILKTLENEMLFARDYTETYEPPILYRAFCKVAKRSLRLYVLENHVVSPLEMLAVLGEDTHLVRVYERGKRDAQIEKRIEYIYANNHKAKVQAGEHRIQIPPRQLSPTQLIALVLVVILAITMVALPLPVSNLFLSSFGQGTVESPYVVANRSQLEQAFESEKKAVFLLSAPLELEELPKGAANFIGEFDGGGHTITVKKAPQTPVFGAISGSFKNVSFVFLEREERLVENGDCLSILAKENKGEIGNVSVTLALSLKMNGLEPEYDEGGNLIERDSTSFALFAKENMGTIVNCTGKVTLSAEGNGHNAEIGGFVYRNSGTIQNGRMLEGSHITTNTVDVGGIAAQNVVRGLIERCENDAVITQTATHAEWNPFVGGIAITNAGEIRSVANFGAITSELASEAESSGTVVAAGIVCRNIGAVNKSANYGKVQASTKWAGAYLGGIAAQNIDETASGTVGIDGCISEGALVVKNESSDYYSFAGGVVGYNTASIKNSISLATLTSLTGEELALMGGIIGANEVYLPFLATQYVILGYVENTYYLQSLTAEGTSRNGVFALVDGGVQRPYFNDDFRIRKNGEVVLATTGVAKKEDISEGYWVYERIS